MINPIDLENRFEEFMQNLPQYLPDGVLPVDLELLNSLGMLHADLSNEEEVHESIYQFYVIETADKLTLYNQNYIIWIVPRIDASHTSTLVLVALNSFNKPHLEMAYSASGVYNTSRLVLGILNRFLNEIKETQELICKMENNRPTGS